MNQLIFTLFGYVIEYRSTAINTVFKTSDFYNENILWHLKIMRL